MMAGKAGSAFRFLNRLVLRRRPGSRSPGGQNAGGVSGVLRSITRTTTKDDDDWGGLPKASPSPPLPLTPSLSPILQLLNSFRISRRDDLQCLRKDLKSNGGGSNRVPIDVHGQTPRGRDLQALSLKHFHFRVVMAMTTANRPEMA
jgi:hypothetical protein